MTAAPAPVAADQGGAGRTTAARRLRLVAVNPTGQHGGAETVLVRLLEAAAGAGWEVTCLSPDGPLRRRLGDAGLGWRPLPPLKRPAGTPALGALRWAWCTAAGARRLRRASRRADVVLANGMFALPALRLAGGRTPTVWLVHDVIVKSSWLRILAATRRGVGLAVAVSEAAAAPVRRAGLRVVVQGNGTPWPVAPVAGPPDHPVVGCAALLTHWKGQHVLLDAVARLGRQDGRPGVTVELAGGHLPGDAAYVEGLRRRAAQPDLAGRVRFLGAVDPIDARMRTWSALVSPSVEPEAAGLSIMEAMSIGLPVVATDHGAPPGYVGDAGRLVPPGDPGALAAGLAALLHDRDAWDRCHRAGPAIVADRLQLAEQQAAMLEILAAAAKPGSRAGSARAPAGTA